MLEFGMGDPLSCLLSAGVKNMMVVALDEDTKTNAEGFGLPAFRMDIAVSAVAPGVPLPALEYIRTFTICIPHSTICFRPPPQKHRCCCCTKPPHSPPPAPCCCCCTYAPMHPAAIQTVPRPHPHGFTESHFKPAPAPSPSNHNRCPITALPTDPRQPEELRQQPRGVGPQVPHPAGEPQLVA